MKVITINGQVGSAGPEIGAEVARQMQFDYVDRLILAEAAKRLGASVEALAEKEQRMPNLGERIARFLQRLLERSAAAGVAGDPYFGPGMDVLLGQDYPHAVAEPITRADQLEDERFIEATTAVIRDLAAEGNAVIIGRAGNLILKDYPDALHVGLVCSSMEARIKVIADREGISAEEAEQRVNEHEKARVAYFRRFFKASGVDPANYHLMLNTSGLGRDQVARIIVGAASS